MNKSEFIVGNKYIITSATSEGMVYPYRAKGLILTALYDDGSDFPRFTLPDGMTNSFGDTWTYFDVEQVEPYVENESIQPFVVMGVGDKWYILKPNGERVDVYFSTTKAAFAVARTLSEVYHA